ncbi:hypothetical protein B0H14DRAFT_2589004 [Mycena olivaceomarginata]|nr:hypothetical protein B0H14DRAFT_2589004 [Mycena olivaceomarginata]
MLWRHPPSIADITLGAWSYFREKLEIAESGKDEMYMLKLGKGNWEKQVEEGESLWNGYSATSKSLWMYSWERSAPSTKGQEPPIPEGKDLPLKDPSKEQVLFKDVKGAWAHQDKSDVDAASTGSPSPLSRAAPAQMEGVESELTPPVKATPAVPAAPYVDGWTLQWVEAPIESASPTLREQNRECWAGRPSLWDGGEGEDGQMRGEVGATSPLQEQRFPPDAPREWNLLPLQRQPLCTPVFTPPPLPQNKIRDLGTLPLMLAQLATIPLHTLCVPFSCQEVQREVKMFGLLLSLKVETTMLQAEIQVTLILLELEVALPLSIPLLLPLLLLFLISLPLPISKPKVFAQSPSLVPQHYPLYSRKKERSRLHPLSYEWRTEESSPASGQSLLKQFGDESIASLSCSLLDRFNNVGDVEMPEASIYQ